MPFQPTDLTRAQLEERRRLGAHLLRRKQLSQAEIARHLGVSRSAVSQWASQLALGGLRHLRLRHSSGRPAKLAKAQKQILLRLLKRGARAAGYPTERWTLQRIQKLIAREFQVTYHPSYLSRLLKQLGWSPQVPLPRAKERDGKGSFGLGSHTTGQGLKKARRNGAEIVFFDEFGFSFQEPLARTWAPRGQRPILRRVERERRGVSTAVGLTLSGRIYKRHFKHGMKSAHVIEVLKHLQRHLRKPLLIIWDRASIHTSRETRSYLKTQPELSVEYLPAYAPELNPEELCHGNVKAHLKNVTPDTTDEVCAMLDRGFARLRRRPDLLYRFIRHAGLVVKQLW